MRLVPLVQCHTTWVEIKTELKLDLSLDPKIPKSMTKTISLSFPEFEGGSYLVGKNGNVHWTVGPYGNLQVDLIIPPHTH